MAIAVVTFSHPEGVARNESDLDAMVIEQVQIFLCWSPYTEFISATSSQESDKVPTQSQDGHPVGALEAFCLWQQGHLPESVFCQGVPHASPACASVLECGSKP